MAVYSTPERVAIASAQPKPCDLPSAESTTSFWHRDPSTLLKGHRTTRDLPKTADVVIIGSGVTGASVAHHLLDEGNRDLDVVLLESREACWGATGRNGGHCQPVLVHRTLDPSIGMFELQNFDALRSIISDRDIDCEFVTQPGVRAIYDQTLLQEIQQQVQELRDASPVLGSKTMVETDEASLRTFRVPTALGALVTDTAARLWPYKFVARILEDLVKSTNSRGRFNLQTLTSVESIETHSADNVLVRTARGTIRAKKVVLATNAYTSHLLHDFADLIVPCRGQMSALYPVPSLSHQQRLQTSIGLEGTGMDDYLIQRPNEDGGHLMFGGGRQHGPSLGIANDNEVNDDVARYLRHRLLRAMDLPEGRDREFADAGMRAEYMWTGIMGFSRDDRPWVGAVPDRPNVFLSAGYTGHGMPNAWLCGKAVALMVEEAIRGADADAAMHKAGDVVGLPKSYRISKDRFVTARSLETVEARDWAEMERGREQ